MLFGKKKIIGLDIGSSAIKLAEIDQGRSQSSLVSFAMMKTPPSAVNAGEIADPQALAEAIMQLVQEIKTKRKNVATSLWGSSVIVKRISVPRMDEKLVGEQIRWEAEQYIPYDIKEVNLEFKVLKGQEASSETMDILLVAAVQDQVYKFVEIIQLAGLTCSVLDVAGFALANCYEKNYESRPGEVVALLNVGASATNFVVVENKDVVFCRDIPVGGSTYTQELHKGLGVSVEEAEAIKIGLSRGQPSPDQALRILQSTHDVLFDEINSSLEFYHNTAGDAKIGRTFVSGGAIKTPGLTEKMGQAFSVQVLDPFKNIKVNSRTFSASYISEVRDFAAVVVGLAERKLDDA